MWKLPSLLKRTAPSSAGFTLMETLVSVAIFSLALALLYNFFTQSVGSQRYTNEQALAVSSLRQGMETMVKELREASNGAEGSYILTEAGDQEIIFFSDIDTDAAAEKVRYFLVGTDLKKGVTEPAGDPPNYTTNPEVVSIISPYIRNNSNPIFKYFNGDYPGDNVNNPLPNPRRLTDTKMVQIYLLVNVNLALAPDSLELTSNVQIRNLKTNL